MNLNTLSALLSILTAAVAVLGFAGILAGFLYAAVDTLWGAL